MINVATNSGDIPCRTVQEVESVIRKSSANPFDDIWISGEEEYPCLAVLLNGRLTCVHFFLNDGGDMWLSEGNYHEDTEFIAGGQKTIIPKEYVIPLEKTLECVRQFCDSFERPDCIAWSEL